MSKATLVSLRRLIQSSKFLDENTLVGQLLSEHPLNEEDQRIAETKAASLVEACRATKLNSSWVEAFLLEFGLSNQEGVALIRLAESLLRVPDKVTADRLIAEKIQAGDWLSHTGKSKSWQTNLATWGLVLSAKLVKFDSQLLQKPEALVTKLTAKLTGPIIRVTVIRAIRRVASHYVIGRNVAHGIERGLKQNLLNDAQFSFGILGEAARTEQDAQRYFDSFNRAIEEIGLLNVSDDIIKSNGISIKLSTLHPQFQFSHRDKVIDELLPRVTRLALMAKHHNIGLILEAEEIARLEISLDIVQALCENSALADWHGLGFVVQAYQKGAPQVTRWLTALADQTNRTITVCLVKGAYWNTEIKLAQEQGFIDYPVFTRNTHTDVCYLQCAQILLQANHNIDAQFATHNPHTAVAISLMAKKLNVSNYKFQRLHGMSQMLYQQLETSEGLAQVPLRIYAPIGPHEDLLPFLVRRLMENKASDSFVDQCLKPHISDQSLSKDCFALAKANKPYRHSGIPLPRDLFLSESSKRVNSLGLDLDDQASVESLQKAISEASSTSLVGHSIIDGEAIISSEQRSINPSNIEHVVGTFYSLQFNQALSALESADKAATSWSSTSCQERASVLIKMSELIESNRQELISMINLEAGRTLADCVSEVREAVDFCRYYAEQCLAHEEHRGQGVFLCISPWNFPLAIFVGQVAAALATGNCVLAKPANATPIISTRIAQLFHQAGVPPNVLHLLVGDATMIGNAILTDTRLSGVAFTGSSSVARTIAQKLAEREGPSLPYIAETSGQNCMIVDSSALPEQVVDNVVASAFHSAGQRCSSLRVLYLQDSIADDVLHMLKGALSILTVAPASDLSSDVGPIINQVAKVKLDEHLAKILAIASQHFSAPLSEACGSGTFFAPTVVEIDSIKRLDQEVFGPILHVIRYKMRDLPKVIRDINSTGFGLTFGVQTRIDAFANHLFQQTNAGNTYINCDTLGAVVGVNPFGGNGLSGTGPKAGGPNYLLRFLQPVNNGTSQKTQDAIEQIKRREAQIIAGPMGERNELSQVPVGNLLVILNEQSPFKELSLICNIALAAGNNLTLSVRNMANQAQYDALLQDISETFHHQINVTEENLLARVSNKAHDGILLHRSNPDLERYRARVALRKGAIIPMIEFDETCMFEANLPSLLSRLTHERTKTENFSSQSR